MLDSRFSQPLAYCEMQRSRTVGIRLQLGTSVASNQGRMYDDMATSLVVFHLHRTFLDKSYISGRFLQIVLRRRLYSFFVICGLPRLQRLMNLQRHNMFFIIIQNFILPKQGSCISKVSADTIRTQQSCTERLYILIAATDKFNCTSTYSILFSSLILCIRFRLYMEFEKQYVKHDGQQ